MAQFELLPSGQSEKIMSCDASLAVGDLVYLDELVSEAVLKAEDNNTPRPVIGYVKAKPEVSSALIVFFGLIDTGLPLLAGSIFVGASGEITNDVQTANFLQKIGTSLGDGQLFFNPSFTRVLRS